MNRDELHLIVTRKLEDKKCRKTPVEISREQIASDVEKFLSSGGKITQVPITACADNMVTIMVHQTSNKAIIDHRRRMATKNSRKAKSVIHG